VRKNSARPVAGGWRAIVPIGNSVLFEIVAINPMLILLSALLSTLGCCMRIFAPGHRSACHWIRFPRGLLLRLSRRSDFHAGECEIFDTLSLLPGVRRRDSFGKASDRALDLPETLSIPSRPRLQPCATLSLTAKNPFNPQYA
jgi:hypothetical protein